MKRLSTLLRRLPKNIRSNRWWILWSGALYLRQPRSGLSINIPPGRLYAVWTDWLRASALRGNQKIASLVPHLGRFGNSSVRLASNLAEATSFGLGHLVVPDSAIFDTGVFRPGVYGEEGLPYIWLASDGERGHERPTHLILKAEHDRHQFLPSTRQQAYSNAWERLGKILECDVDPSPFTDNHLVIHLRGGDVFSDRKPAAYGQPPLAYYELVVKSRPWSFVTIVHGDGGNPLVDSLCALCAELGIENEVQASTLMEDLEVLFSARVLVAGRGTFIPAVAAFSRHLQTLYYFENKFSLDPSLSDLSVFRVYDREGRYTKEILSNNWENSPTQRDLMVRYPVDSLEMEQVQASESRR